MPNYTKNSEAISNLSAEQFRVTQQSGTERPFENAYWDHDEPGLYVDIVSGEPLFHPWTSSTVTAAGPASPSQLSPKTWTSAQTAATG